MLLALSASLAAQGGYRMPPADVAALVDAPAAPGTSFSPDGRTLLLSAVPGVPTIADLSAPEHRLAGYRINPATWGPSRAGYSTGLTLVDVATGRERAVSGLPSEPRIRNLSWSPDGSHIAFTHQSANGQELWVLEVASARARHRAGVRVHDVWGSGALNWMPDNRTLLVRSVPAGVGAEPVRNTVPTGPVIQETEAEASPAPTYQDLLADAHDEALFDHYFTAQYVMVPLNGRVVAVGPKGVHAGADPSPDGRFILVRTLLKPWSYNLPAGRFAETTTVWNRDGRQVAVIAEHPVRERIPLAPNSTFPGRRSIQWRADAPAQLFWVEALDGGDARTSADLRDRAYLLEAPFTAAPTRWFATATRFAGIQWGRGDLALVSETWRATRTLKTWRVAPASPAQAPALLVERNYEDSYNNPGSPLTTATPDGGRVLRTWGDSETLVLSGMGAGPEGNRPFLRSWNLGTGETTEIWRSAAPYFETPALLADAGTVVIRRESPTEPPNLVVKSLNGGTDRALTAFPHPTPQFRDIRAEFITYTRADGVGLSAQLLLPAGWDSTKGTLPVMIWAYPREFGSADAAGQVSDSPYRFNAISYWGPHFLVTQGYAVLNNAAMPIVAVQQGAEPNDTFVDQLRLNAEAAIGELVRRGVSDGRRLAVGGHSYGAFMTANLLAHTDLFQAGIARSGAYNRSLTPFGFQAEPRDLWEATDTYIEMSPFFHAHKINEPMLMIHGMADNNTGTFPMQSERMFQAMRGKGGKTRLVMLPHESHGYRARESLMHMLWEQLDWLNTYVK